MCVTHARHNARSFVRSITMDKWSPDQLAKMKAGGNTKFLEFMRSYGPEGGYRENPPMTIREKYNTWAAKEYREKVSLGTHVL